MFPYLCFLIISEHPWNLSQNSATGCLAMTFLSMYFPCGPRFLICFISDWSCSYQDAVGACLSASVVFFYLGVTTQSMRGSALFKFHLFLHFWSIFIFKCLHPDIILHKLTSLVVSAWLKVCNHVAALGNRSWHGYVCGRFYILFAQY